MNYLVVEILLRLSKALAATILALIVYLVLTGPIGASGSAELALLAWTASAAFVLLLESSPI